MIIVHGIALLKSTKVTECMLKQSLGEMKSLTTRTPGNGNIQGQSCKTLESNLVGMAGEYFQHSASAPFSLPHVPQ